MTDNTLAIVDFSYRKETDEDKADFTRVLNGEGEWEQIKIPHYVGPDGRWNAFYRAELCLDKKEEGKYYLLDFEAVDYIAEVYINGRMAGRHEGFFAPFSVNITDYIHTGKNTLLIVVKNDVTSTAVTIDGYAHYGDKIYGATHFGYNEPILGWHHCPAGAGSVRNGELLWRGGYFYRCIFHIAEGPAGLRLLDDGTGFADHRHYFAVPSRPSHLSAHRVCAHAAVDRKLVVSYDSGSAHDI